MSVIIKKKKKKLGNHVFIQWYPWQPPESILDLAVGKMSILQQVKKIKLFRACFPVFEGMGNSIIILTK